MSPGTDKLGSSPSGEMADYGKAKGSNEFG
jgi:hypothetical protein